MTLMVIYQLSIVMTVKERGCDVSFSEAIENSVKDPKDYQNYSPCVIVSIISSISSVT